MDQLDELFNYKNQLLGELVQNEAIVTLLDDDLGRPENPEALIYSQVFPYEFVPDTVEHGYTFVCSEVDIRSVSNKVFLEPVLYIWIFTHKSKVRLPTGGLRVDKLSSEIVELLNGSRMYGLGELNLESARRFSPITQYQGRILTFSAKDFNRLNPTGKTVPPNRRA